MRELLTRIRAVLRRYEGGGATVVQGPSMAWRLALVLALLTYGAQKLGESSALVSDGIAILWPPNAIAITFLLVTPATIWPWLLLVGAAKLSLEPALGLGAPQTLIDTIEIVTVAACVRWR